jgi:hypothetical protein
VQDVVKPGARTDILVNSVKNDIRSLSKSDVLIFWGGVNDFEKKKKTLQRPYTISWTSP